MATRIPSRKLLGLAASVSLFALGCQGTPEDESSEPYDLEVSAQALEVYDGEALLQGLFFGVGPVAAAVPEIWGNKPVPKESASSVFRRRIKELERSGEATELDDKVADLIAQSEPKSERVAYEVSKQAIARIAEQDPRFIRQFQKEIYSGDPVIVSSAIEDAGRRFAELLEIEAFRDPGRYGSEWVFNENMVVNVNGALNVNVAVNVDTAYNVTQFWSREFLDRESMLRSQVIVARITERFAGARFGR